LSNLKTGLDRLGFALDWAGAVIGAIAIIPVAVGMVAWMFLDWRWVPVFAAALIWLIWITRRRFRRLTEERKTF
jgi:membrane protein implicated in regulation of membrane protease activity